MSIRQRTSWPLVLILAALVHTDWHFARPLHHRLSLGWPTHWLFCVVVFAITGWYIARKWPRAPWQAVAWNVGLALFLAQIVEPVLEELFYEHAFGYPVEPERWTAFMECVVAGIPALAIAVWRMTSTRRDDVAS